MRSARWNYQHKGPHGRARGTQAALRLAIGAAFGVLLWAFIAIMDVSPFWSPWSLRVLLAQEAQTAAYCFEVSLPISDTVEKRVTRRVEQAIAKLPKNGSRPIFVFEFNPRNGTAGEGSSFGDALDLARFISGDRLGQARVKTVAWLPRSVKGHAVLPVLACEQIIMARDAEVGAAGSGEKQAIDNALRDEYQHIAERRQTVRPAVALGMLDKDLAVYKVTLVQNKEVRYVMADELKRLQQQGLVGTQDTLFSPGDPHVLSAQAMRDAGFATHLAENRRSLAAALQLPLASVVQDLMPEEGWQPLRVDVSGPIHKQAINWILSSLDEQRKRRQFNVLVVNLNTGGGDLNESKRLADQLATLSERVHTVAYVNREALSDAALIALACDELVMHPDAKLGGPGEGKNLHNADLAVVRGSLQEMFGKLGRDWSLPLALIDPDIEVHRYSNPTTGEVRYLSAEERDTVPNIAEWQDNGPVTTAAGLDAVTAESLGLARSTAQTIDELKASYQIEGDFPAARPNWVLTFVEWLADPRIASLLLFVGGFALLFELSTPGATVPGFIALVCFLLFFWAKFLHGTADWLEVLLFMGGVVCLAVELFALPGFGIFGFGGGLMIVASIILASQTFIVPTNAYQMRQFPVSLLMMAAGMMGGIVSVLVIRRFLPDTPYFNRMLLRPPLPEEREERSRREALATFDHLQSKRGITMTPLVPAGKVQFGDELVDCISNGELIAKNTPVVVEEVAGNRVVVRKINP
jgi:membrane-bound serine protease (ClpP class)